MHPSNIIEKKSYNWYSENTKHNYKKFPKKLNKHNDCKNYLKGIR